MAIGFCSVGENVPLVTSPIGLLAGEDAVALARHALAGKFQADADSLGAVLLDRRERVGAGKVAVFQIRRRSQVRPGAD